jgi:hypothetical protein
MTKDPEQEGWEPWQPSPGDRVRVRLSAECQFQYPGTTICHRPQMDGVTGVVSDAPVLGFPRCDHRGHDASHRYSVLFDAPVVLGRGSRWKNSSLGQCFAAIELDLISDPAEGGA